MRTLGAPEQAVVEPSLWQRLAYRFGMRLPDDFRPWIARDISSDAYGYRRANTAVLLPLFAVLFGLRSSRSSPMLILGLGYFVFVYAQSVRNADRLRELAYYRHKVRPDGSRWPDAPKPPSPFGETKPWHWVLALAISVGATAAIIAYEF